MLPKLSPAAIVYSVAPSVGVVPRRHFGRDCRWRTCRRSWDVRFGRDGNIGRLKNSAGHRGLFLSGSGFGRYFLVFLAALHQ